ncbi:MAG: methionyl-tRNA formyltransferase [bacterium]
MRLLFMGTPGFAVPSLDALLDEGYNIVGVVTQPDKPKGRGLKLSVSPVKEVALKRKLTLYQPASIKTASFTDELKTLDLDIAVVVAYGKILPKEILSLPGLGCVNVHASLLPKYRGAAPINWAIINGEEQTGITIMYMDVGLDCGNIIAQEAIKIFSSDTAGILHDKLSYFGAELLIKSLKKIKGGDPDSYPQDHKLATYAPILKKEDGRIDWAKTAQEIRNLVRGVNPWPGAYTCLNGNLLKIWRVELGEGVEVPELSELSKIPGKIVKIDKKEGIYITTGNGILCIKELQKEGGKRMKVNEFLRGNRIEIEDLFQ